MENKVKTTVINGKEIEVESLYPSLVENFTDFSPADKQENLNILNELELKSIEGIAAALVNRDLKAPLFPDESTLDATSTKSNVDAESTINTEDDSGKLPLNEGDKQLEINNRSVFVNNVEYKVTTEELKAHFKSWGEILRITIKCNKKTGKPKGHAFIEFETEEATNKAIELNESMLKGRQIKVIKKRINVPGKKRIIKKAAKSGHYGYPSVRGMMNPFPFSMHMPYMPYPVRGIRPRGRGRY